MTEPPIPAGEERVALLSALNDLVTAAQAWRFTEQLAARKLALQSFDAMRERLAAETDFELAGELIATGTWISARESSAGVHLDRLARAVAFMRGDRRERQNSDVRGLIQNDPVCAAIAQLVRQEERERVGVPITATVVHVSDEMVSQLLEGWSKPVQIRIHRQTDNVLEFICRRPQDDQSAPAGGTR